MPGRSSWGNVTPELPSQLLHVPSMTSVRLPLPGNPIPKYNILSYTWGRWKSEEHRPIGIKGTTWRIPAVKPDLFSPEKFEKVLRRVAQDVEYVWVHVARINQGKNSEGIAEGMDQIGKQMGIFQGATQAYIWLSRSTLEDLEMLDESEEYFLEFIDLLNDMKSARDGEPIDEESALEVLDNAMRALRSWSSDPWFSSLWTLQESILRRDAILLSHEGETLLSPDDETPMSLNITGNFLRHVLKRIVLYLQKSATSSTLTQKMAEARDEIRTNVLAFMVCSNPNVPFGLARYRTARREEDYIYGIMQVYGLRLGKTIEPTKSFTLEQLKNQLSVRLNEQSPVLAQIFVHSQSPEVGRSWQITQQSWVPSPLISYEQKPREASDCTIFIDADMHAIIRGRAWPLADMVPLMETVSSWGNFVLDHNFNVGNEK